ncbi:F-box-like, putative [Angomonas deanei]|uniref:F-box-like, putative n=1 Tax=Angomonas deanei TaxID=59799 RepID=A0A7G2CJ62_9TRYP|nr:F-box-like, putative [Angomonas deanei]
MTDQQLSLSEDTYARLQSAASLHRATSIDHFVQYLLKQFHDSLGGLPTPVLHSIFTFLDYTTAISIVQLVCKKWKNICFVKDPSQFFLKLRQVHGVHLLDPARGLFYFPRALKRVLVGNNHQNNNENENIHNYYATNDHSNLVKYGGDPLAGTTGV